MNYPIEGSCQCGGVKYTLSEAPMMVVACHCIECQKLATSAFSITAIVKTETVVFEGEMAEWSRLADSGKVSGAKFCPTCGNRMYHFDPAAPETLKLKPANLDDTSGIAPTAHIWVSQKQEWYEIPAGVKVFEGQP